MKVVLLAIVLCTTSCAGQFVDEMQVYEKECLGEDVFPCMSGGCIQQSQYCDGKVDCDDGTDENYCLDHKPDAQFCNETHQFMCRDSKKCIPNHWICNNDIDCDDGSDELNCTLVPVATGKCKGFLCGDGKCISSLWLCDGSYDCKDKSDENSPENCRHSLLSHSMLSGSDCPEWLGGRRQYKCTDSSFCLPSEMMCDGMQDCKDGSDERPFCANWHTMCANHTCLGDKASCVPDRAGPTCECLNHLNLRRYNTSTGACDDIDECALARPQCSHYCVNADGHFTCECADGYFKDELKYLCYATGPEPLLFYSTRNEIKYLKVKSKEVVTLATGIKKAHGVTSNGIYVYWVETAEGHQAIVKAHIDDVENTRQVIVGLGLEDPGDIAIDFMARHIYFGDAERGLIFVCYDSGFKCFTLKADTKHPKFITLDPVHGKMYWADWHSRPVIMRAKMDGSSSEVLVESMTSFASGLALDVPNDRLYFVDKTIKVVLLSTKVVYSLFKEAHHHPYAISVFENTVYWSDWISDSIQTTDKIHSSSQRQVLLKMDTSVFGLHMYHPALMKKIPHPCDEHPCSHFCLVTSIDTYSCACPDEMENKNGRCIPKDDYRPLHLIVGSGRLFTKFRLDAMGNPHSHVTNFSLGRVQAMTYDSVRDRLYVYDGREHSISYTNMSDFTHGKVFALIKFGPENVVDMDYDYVSDSLYMLDSGSGYIEVLSLRTLHRAVVYRFTDRETPVSFCVLPHYGKMLVAVMQTDNDNRIYVDSIGLDGDGRRHIVTVNIRGPRIILRFLHGMDNVYLADEGNGIIDYLHPEGTGRENFRELSTSISSMAVTENYIFWTDRRTPKLYWANIHETSHKIRRIELRAFSNSSQLLLQTTYPPPSPHDPLTQHPCHRDNPCSQVCVPTHSPTNPYSYKCLCSPGLVFSNGRCTEVARCSESEIYCHKSNICVEKHKRCNGVVDCSRGEDEEGCTHITKKPKSQCDPNEILCYELCVAKDSPSPCSPKNHSDITKKPENQCDPNEILCYGLCVAKDSPSPCSSEKHSDITKKPENQCDPNEILCYGLCVAKDSPSPCSSEKHSDITKKPENQCDPNEILCYGLCVAKDSPSPCSSEKHSDITKKPESQCNPNEILCYGLCVAKDSPSPCSPEKHSDITKKPESQCDPNEILCYGLCVAKDSPSPCSPEKHSDITKKPESQCNPNEILCYGLCVAKDSPSPCSPEKNSDITKKPESQCDPNEILCYGLCVAKDSPSLCSPEKHSDITKKPESQCNPNEILCYGLCVAKDSPSPCSPEKNSDITKKPESQCDPNEILCYGLCVAKDSPSPCSPEKHSDITKQPESQCEPNEILCYGLCVAKDSPSPCSPATHSVVADLTTPPPLKCDWIQFSCKESPVCISRSLLCDGAKDCPDGSDEGPDNCDTLACFDTEFMCASGSCILKTWKCDGDQDCNDASDEIDCESVSCKPGYYQCRDRECIELKKRCDGHQDCFDYSDEEECDEPVVVEEPKIHRCAEWEYSCERNRSICLPITARCNMKTDCPGGTDEIGCDYRCTPHGMFGCKQQIRCLAMNRVCDGNKECDDGSDETPDACALVNRTSHLYPVMLYPAAECRDGFLCGNGQCIEWAEVCDRTPNCFDGSDESIHCFSACDNNTCAHACQATPLGPRCLCPAGYSAAPDRRTCADVDECRAGLCSQACVNTPGSFLCSCHHGYALRSDRRSCKAVTGNMSILYVSGNTVRSVSADGYGAIEYSDPDLGDITDLDFNVRTKRLYVTSTESGKLIELNVTHDVVAVTNVGRPTRVAVDWVTGNVYFADSTPGASCVRVCDVTRRRCARLQKIPSDATVKALIVEPASRRMFYCVQRGHESVVWSASLSGRSALDLLHVTQCSGLAADSFTRRLYVAETAPPHIMVVDFDGKNPKKILTERPQLQAPHALALFEDHIYYLVGDSYRLGRCLLHGPKNCETYIYRVFDANTFVIRHESIQRDDLVNECAAHDCSNVCVLEKAPVCVCDDGHVRDDGNCDPSNKNELPLFNGWTYQDYQRGHRASITVVIAVLVLFLVYIALFIYYHFVYKPKRKRSTAYTEVRFQNSSDEAAQLSCSPAVQMNGNQLINGNEFVNPLQYVRNVWQQSIRRKPRPVCTAGLSIAVPNSPQQDFSDTESDLDDRETKRFIRKNKFLN
uniref:EGF-like domain-containing protein n=2 Tax=Bombyx mori TaxID=7091 RepID=A0A8R2M3L2_BOMMO|nr:vitellogenin receptor isoform X7 [Bombyx mori]